MAADLLKLGLEVTTALTIALIAVMLLRGPVRALFGARAAYCLWLLAPAVILAVALPRAATPAAQAVAAEAASSSALSAREPASAASAPAAPPRPSGLPDPADMALPLLALWGLGFAVQAGLLARRQRRFLGALGPLRPEQRVEGRVFHAARADVGPALVGALTPRVVLPVDFADRFTPQEQAVVVAHERIHLSGGDAQINLLAAALQAAFWFHPLVQIAVPLLRVDQELACDETVVARFPGARRLYAEAMLKTQLGSAPVPLGCHWLAGGRAQLRVRITRLNVRTGRFRRLTGVALAAAVASAGGVAAWAAQPATQNPPPARRLDAAGARELIAAVRNDPDQAAAMIRAGSNPDAEVFGEGSPLTIAVRDGRRELVDLMLRQGADPNRRVPGDGSALISAAAGGDLAMVDLLLAHRADPDLPVHGDGSPLIAAAGGGHVEIIDRLLAAGARVDRIVPSDETALITAARRGRLAAVQRLVEAGADVNLAVDAPRYLQPPERRSPLSAARRSGRTDIADYLIAHGARA